MSGDEMKAVARTASEAVNTKDLSLLDGHPGYWQTRQVFPYLFGSFPDARDTVEQQTVAGEWVTTRTTLRGTHTGDFLGTAPTGRAIEMMTLSLDRVVDGTVVEHYALADHLSALITVGAIALPADLAARRVEAGTR